MNIVQINMTAYGSTGKIMFSISDVLMGKGIGSYTFSTQVFSVNGKEKKIDRCNHIYYGNFWDNTIGAILSKFIGVNGILPYFGTQHLINKLKKINPNVIHLHNTHNFCINFPALIDYINENDIVVVWTLHDCWTFTGHCANFDFVGCEKWRQGCFDCKCYKEYPKVYLDNTSLEYRLKKKWFTSIKNLTIVTPSQWLAELVKQSYLKDYPVKVINNGIDLNVFKPTKSDFREKYNLEDKKIVLGVAFGWGVRKGLDVFIKLAKTLPENYQIVLVGTDNNVEKQLPKNIISIQRTNNQKELAEIYTAADVFVNPTREDNYPTVNMEAIACGTSVITFNTGGSPECIDESCGCVVEKDDFENLEKEIIRICENKPYTLEDCLNKAKSFDMNEKFEEYIKLYENCTHST